MAPSSLNQTELYAQTARLSFSSYEDPLRFMVVLIKRKQEFLLIVMYFCFDTWILFLLKKYTETEIALPKVLYFH